MDIRTEDLSRFVGGQVDIQDYDADLSLRGEIQAIAVADDELKIETVWMALFKDETWTSVPERLSYSISLLKSKAIDGGEDRIVVTGHPPESYVLLSLFPKGGHRLDPAKVKGLVQTT